jgi:hypothetical protein
VQIRNTSRQGFKMAPYRKMISFFSEITHLRGRRGRDRMVVGFTTSYDLHSFYSLQRKIKLRCSFIDANHYDFSVIVTNFGPKLRCYGQQSTCYDFRLFVPIFFSSLQKLHLFPQTSEIDKNVLCSLTTRDRTRNG